VVDPSGRPDSQGQEDAHVCVYAILPAAEIEMPSLFGIDPSGAIYALAGNAVQAVISRVRADRFDQAALEAGLQDPVWVDVHVRAHQQVLDSLVATGQPVIPLRFCTIYRDEAAVRTLMTTYESALTAELDRLRGQREWGVKLFVLQGQLQAAILNHHTDLGSWAADAGLQALQARVAGMSTGAAFLLQKKLDTLVAERSGDVAAWIADESHARLASQAVATTTMALQPNASGMELNAAYLVAEQKLDEFRAELERLGEEYGEVGARYELSGPWPAYNFIDLDLSDDRSGQ